MRVAHVGFRCRYIHVSPINISLALVSQGYCSKSTTNWVAKTTEIYALKGLDSKSPKQVRLVPPEVCEGQCVLFLSPSFWQPQICLAFRQPSSPVSLHCLSLYPKFSSLWRLHSYWLRAHPNELILTWFSNADPISKWGRIHRYWGVRTSTSLWGT